MDADTLILLILTFGAFCWWFSIRLHEDRQVIKELNREKEESLKRAERVKQLTNRM